VFPGGGAFTPSETPDTDSRTKLANRTREGQGEGRATPGPTPSLQTNGLPVGYQPVMKMAGSVNPANTKL
jgi:hypothetical protein